MSERDAHRHEVALTALDGANPLGFLAALGTLVTLNGAGETAARLRWRRGASWLPVIEGVSVTEPDAFSATVARGLRGRAISADGDARRDETQKAYEAARTAAKNKFEEIKKRGLSRDERRKAIEAELRPLESESERKRDSWLKALADAVPRRELALGKRLDCAGDEYRQHALAFRADADPRERDALDLLAAFGSDACLQQRGDTIEPTPFQFITGSGHQFFLETVRQLVDNVSQELVRRTLFEPWTYSDEGLSMRWDPLDDRRYALIDRDPTASDNKSRTVWMANLLAYRALALLPSAARRGGLATSGWAIVDHELAFSWPVWEFPASIDAVRSLVQLRDLTAARPEGPALQARGVTEVFRSRRVKVGTGANFKLNFSPSRRV